MKIAICAIAKNENYYINDWIKYHLNLGFDKIFIYDNNDSSYEDVYTKIDKTFYSNIEIIRINDTFADQKKRYQELYDKEKYNFDFIAFIDLDEYITLESNEYSLKDLLSNLPSDTEQVHLKMLEYGDSNKILYENLPVYERFTKIANFNWHAIKSFIKGNQNIKISSPHYAMRSDSSELISYFIDGNKYKVRNNLSRARYRFGTDCTINDIKGAKVYIRHFDTKTIDEYITFKFNRPDACFSSTKNLSKPIPSRYFWKRNHKTVDKLKVLLNAPYNNTMDIVILYDKDVDIKSFNLLSYCRKVHICGNNIISKEPNNNSIIYHKTWGLLDDINNEEYDDLSEFFIVIKSSDLDSVELKYQFFYENKCCTNSDKIKVYRRSKLEINVLNALK